MLPNYRNGSANSFFVWLGAAVAILVVLSLLLMNLESSPEGPSANQGNDQDAANNGDSSESLFVYCAAGMRLPADAVAKEYEKKFGVPVQLTFGGSNTLLSQIEAAKTGDLYISGDDIYVEQGQQKGLIQEAFPLALMRPVIAVKKGNPLNIQSINDLLREDITTALGNPEQAAVGRKTKKLLSASGHWQNLFPHVEKTGVFLPTVPEIANAVKIGSAQAGIVWDATANQFPELEIVRTPELDKGLAHITLGVLTSSTQPTKAIRFARYLSASDRGLQHFDQLGYEPVQGDPWVESPELTFFCGAVNRRAVEDAIQAFEKREGVRVNTIYNGCGILTAQMRSINQGTAKNQAFPDTYMACDRYYLETVKELFQEDVDISDTEVVIVVPNGNPKGIKSLQDLTQSGVRVSVGQPEQCTIGVLTRQVLKEQDILEKVMENVVTQTATSSLLIPTVTTGSVDATLAYATDTRAEADKIDVIRISSPAAKAIQPFSIAKSSDQKQLARRFYRAILQAKDDFENAGFHWRAGMESSSNSVEKSDE